MKQNAIITPTRINNLNIHHPLLKSIQHVFGQQHRNRLNTKRITNTNTNAKPIWKMKRKRGKRIILLKDNYYNNKREKNKKILKKFIHTRITSNFSEQSSKVPLQ